MTAVARAPRRAEPAARRAPAQHPRVRQRRLRVVDSKQVQTARRVRRLVTALSVVVGAVLVLAVAFHVTLAQGQLELDRLRARAVDEQDGYERARVEVAAAAAPDEIVRRAQELGMIVPDEIRHVSSLPGTTAVVPESPATSPSTLGSWPTVKPHLGE